MNSTGYNRTQVLCGLREAWASIIGHRCEVLADWLTSSADSSSLSLWVKRGLSSLIALSA
jgi:hypothetical protein